MRRAPLTQRYADHPRHMEFLIIPIIIVVIAAIIFGIRAENKRKAALRQFAAQNGLHLAEERNTSTAGHYDFLKPLSTGSNRYVNFHFSGNLQGCSIQAFDHHNETHSTDSKGRRSTHHHWHTVAIVELPRKCPEITIGKEGILSKIAQSFGYQDIDFESAEFSRKFVVRSKDKRFAYDFIHARVMELLLKNRTMFGQMEIDRNCMALIRSGRQNPAQIRNDCNLLIALHGLFPQHLIEDDHHV